MDHCVSWLWLVPVCLHLFPWRQLSWNSNTIESCQVPVRCFTMSTEGTRVGWQLLRGDGAVTVSLPKQQLLPTTLAPLRQIREPTRGCTELLLLWWTDYPRTKCHPFCWLCAHPDSGHGQLFWTLTFKYSTSPLLTLERALSMIQRLYSQVSPNKKTDYNTHKYTVYGGYDVP